jgi:transglutaminase-like putative cysteine protease
MMNRKVLSGAIALFVMIALCAQTGQARERQLTVTMEVNLNAPADAKVVRMWVPYPLSDADQDITNVKISGNYTSTAIHREPKGENMALFVEWNAPQKDRKLVYSYHVRRQDRVMGVLGAADLPLARTELRNYLEPAPAAGSKVKELSDKIVKGKKPLLDKAKAIYDWIVDNLPWDPSARAVGAGDVDKALEKRAGRFADLTAVFVSLCRAAGVPARERTGVRVPKGAAGDMTMSQMGWAEFYLPGVGWVSVNPGLVARLIHDQKPSETQVRAFKEYYFGNADENMIVYGAGREIVLNPPQSGKPLSYFVFPYAEADDKMLNDDLAGMNLRYKIGFKEE